MRKLSIFIDESGDFGEIKESPADQKNSSFISLRNSRKVFKKHGDEMS